MSVWELLSAVLLQKDLSLSRLNHGLPRGEDEPGIMEGTADVPHQIADVHLPEAASVFDAATALDTARDMVDPQPTLVERLVRHVLLPRELLPQIEINLIIDSRRGSSLQAPE